MFVLLTFALWVVLGGTSAGSEDRWTAPPDAAAKPNPRAKNPSATASGRRLFMQRCVSCHGEDGSGQDKGAGNLRSEQAQRQSDGALFWKISNGNPTKGMPSFTSLEENQRWDIVTFIRTLKNSNGASEALGESKKAPADSDSQKEH